MGLGFVRLDHAAKVYVASGNLPTCPQLLGNAAIVSDRLVEEDLFTSALVYRLVCEVQETGGGTERFTRQEIPGVPEEQLGHLDARGIVRRGSEVGFGDILVGKVSPKRSAALTAEEKMLHAIFGQAGADMKDDSLLYPFRDRGVVCGTRLKARRRAHCEQCGEVAAAATDPKVCPHCNGPVQKIAADDLPAGVQAQVIVEVLVRRELCVGDVLQDGKGHQLTVASILPVGKMPRVRQQRVDVLLGAGSTFQLHRKHVLRNTSESRATQRLPGRGDELRLEKLTVHLEEKWVARSPGAPYSLVSQMPMASGTRSGGQWVRMDLLQELWRQGYAVNARELVSIKSDAMEGRTQAYATLIKGEPVTLGVPETTRRFGNLLRALCHSLSFRTASGKEKAFTDDDLSDVDALLVQGASRGDSESWSYGEVKNLETLNFRTYRPVKDGLFCERIFGPERDWECGCGKYRGVQHKDTICDRCGVKVTRTIVRRSRFGHIELVRPVLHCWCFPMLADLLGVSVERFKKIVAGFADLAADPPLTVVSGPLAIKEALERRGVSLDGILIEALPVLPPDLRPLVLLDDGSFAVSDLNDLYRRVINRNTRLRKLIDLNAPAVIVQNEHWMLQQSVDALFDNASAARPVLGASNRRLRSLTDELQWVLRDMGEKRVDYSAQAVAIPDPDVAEGTLGVPRSVLHEIFEPRLIRELKAHGVADTIKGAKKLMAREPEGSNVQEALQRAVAGHPVLVVVDGRRFAGLQPVPVDGEVARLHPADGGRLGLAFRGERVAIHVPLSEAAVEELRHPRPRGEVTPVLTEVTPTALVGSSMSGIPVALTGLDRVLLGIGA